MNIPQIRNVLGVLGLAFLVACGGGGMGGAAPPQGTAPPQVTTPPVSPSTDPGTALVALTDAPGDFLAYNVGVVSVELKRDDGTIVETLPASTQVDFAQLVDVSEIITASQVPPGKYVSVSLTLDYADSLIVVDNGNGGLTVNNDNILNSVTDTALVGANSQLTLVLQLPVASPLVVSSGSISHLALDFDLAASNTVDPEAPNAGTLAGDVKVRVNPVVLAANIVPDPTRQLRLRGTLESVNNMPPSAMSYTVHLAPFNLRDDAVHGDVVVKTTDTTTFSVNGVTKTGTDGLAALAGLPVGSLTLAQGSFDSNTRTYTATSVIAGTSLPTSGSDFLLGTVVARNGNVLTVSGALSCTDYNGHDQVHTLPGNGKGLGHQKSNGNGHGNSNGNGHRKYDGSDDDGWRFEFNRQVLVTVGNNTKVTRAGSTVPLTAQDISVGQRIAAYGKLGIDSAGTRTLDATQGGGRLLVTGLWGNFVSQSADVVTLGLKQLDGRAPGAYNFAGTGTAGNDATAAAYTVALPVPLNAAQPKIATPVVGAPLRFFGFVAPFGSAPPAFNATTLVSYASTVAQVDLNWNSPGVTAPFAQFDTTKLVVDMATLQTAAEAELKLGPQSTDLSKSSLGITFVPNPVATYTAFAMVHRKSGSVSTYGSFQELSAALKVSLNGTTALYRIHAAGPFDPVASALSVDRMYVVLND